MSISIVREIHFTCDGRDHKGDKLVVMRLPRGFKRGEDLDFAKEQAKRLGWYKTSTDDHICPPCLEDLKP